MDEPIVDRLVVGRYNKEPAGIRSGITARGSVQAWPGIFQAVHNRRTRKEKRGEESGRGGEGGRWELPTDQIPYGGPHSFDSECYSTDRGGRDRQFALGGQRRSVAGCTVQQHPLASNALEGRAPPRTLLQQQHRLVRRMRVPEQGSRAGSCWGDDLEQLCSWNSTSSASNLWTETQHAHHRGPMLTLPAYPPTRPVQTR